MNHRIFGSTILGAVHSAIFRTYQQLFPGEDGTHRPPDRSQSPHLFSVFLDPRKSVKSSGSVCFAFDLKVLVPDYEVDGVLFMKRHIEGGFIYREQILVEATPDRDAQGGWRIKYGYQDRNPGKPNLVAESRFLDAPQPTLSFLIPIAQRADPGLHGTLRIEVRHWNEQREPLQPQVPLAQASKENRT